MKIEDFIDMYMKGDITKQYLLSKIESAAKLYTKEALTKAAKEAGVLWRSEKDPSKIEEKSMPLYWIETDLAEVIADKRKIEKTKLPKWNM